MGKKIIKLTESKLSAIITESLINALPKIQKQINEGLIKSYPIDLCKAYLYKCFPNIQSIHPLYNNPYKYYNRVIRPQQTNDFIAISLDCNNYTNFPEIIKTANDLLGWFTGYIDIRKKVNTGYIPYRFYNFNGVFICSKKIKKQEIEMDLFDFLRESPPMDSFEIIIEEKFSDVYHQKPNDVFYHLTDIHKLEKIMRQGLVPKTYGNFPDRIYLGKKVRDIADMVDIDHNSIVVLKVDVSDIKLFKLYRDQRNPTAVYTYDNIPPSKIEIVQ